MHFKGLPTTGILLLIAIFSAVNIGCKTNQGTDFNESNVAEIKAILKDLETDSFSYRVVLPVIQNNKVLNSETLGTLPVSEVERIASSKNIQYSPTGNLQIVVADEGGGAGSHTESCTPCKGKGLDVITRIEKVVKNFDKSKYILIR